jgi:hypothetical protein
MFVSVLVGACLGGNSGHGRTGRLSPLLQVLHHPRFTASGDCVTDNLTGLMWAKDANLINSQWTWRR